MKKIKHVIISTLVPFAIVGLISLIAFLLCDVGLVANDCFEQYVPFLNAYYDVITDGKSIFYSLTGSMGYDFWAVFSYYLVSPLNFIILLFGKSRIVYAANLLIVLKLAFCGGTFSVFLKNRFPKAKCSRIVSFSTIYALCGFMVGYAWNIMWLDGVLLFPLVIMGLDLLMRDRNPKWYWYTLFLSLLIITSYFIGYMSCIFIFLYFFTYNFKSFGDFAKKLVWVGLSSLLAIGISAVILLPSFGGVQSTYISGELLPKHEFYGSYAESLSNFLIGVPQIGISFDRQYANLFMSVFALLLSLVYFTAGSVKPSKKIRNFILLAIMIFSLNFKPLNFIWHGFHEQTGIPNRFSFLITFLLLQMAFEICVQSKKRIKKRSIFAAFGLLTAGAGALAYFNNDLIMQAAITAGLALAYALILAFAHGRAKFVISQIFVYIELIAMLVLGIFTVSSSVIGDYGHYMADFEAINSRKEKGYYREKLDEVYNPGEEYFENEADYIGLDELSVDKIKEYCDFMKSIGHQSVVSEATLYDIKAMSLFNTFNNYDQTLFYCRTGATGGTNNVMYFGENAFMDMLLGVRYYYARYYDVNSTAYEYVGTEGEVGIYRNKYALSVGYTIPDALAAQEFELADNPFESMNILSRNITGSDIFSGRSLKLAEDNNGQTGLLVYTCVLERDEEFLFQPVVSDMQKLEAYVDGELVYTGNRSQCIIDLGELKKGASVRVEITPKKPDEVSASMYAASIDNTVLEDTYNLLAANQLQVREYWDDYLKGTISLEKASKLLITVPYAEGWTVKLDGREIEPQKWCGLFIMLELSEGEHTIEMSYVTPGFREGLYVTLACTAVFIAALIVTLAVSGRRKKKQAASLLSESPKAPEALKPSAASDGISASSDTSDAPEPSEESAVPESPEESAAPETSVAPEVSAAPEAPIAPEVSAAPEALIAPEVPAASEALNESEPPRSDVEVIEVSVSPEEETETAQLEAADRV
ncbi:MAG: YfhO family protein, partial [Butyrivibrio sp.]|nr:YfhO family protein [Butyrivibrio sp.]